MRLADYFFLYSCACRIIIVIGFLIFSLVVTYIFNQRVGIIKTRTSHVAYGGLKSHDSAISIDSPKQTDPVVVDNLGTAVRTEQLIETHRIEITEERSDANVCFERFSSGNEMLEVEVHEEL
jgi:hypothetical protein